MHLLVNIAEVLVILSWLEALLVVASVNSALLLLVLSEIKAFCWEHVRPNTLLEVFIRDKPITIQIKLRKDALELRWVDVKAPEVEEVLEFLLADSSCLFNVEVVETLPYGLPLELYLLENQSWG
jgi:hypothetical protein